MTSGRNINTPNMLFKRQSDIQVVRKTADETVNNSNVLQDDNALLFPVAANEVWVFDIFLRYDSGTIPDFKFDMTIPAGGTIDFLSIVYATDLTGVNYRSRVYMGAAIAVGAGGAGTPICLHVKGIAINGANDGNVVLQWAQNTANASDTKVLANSFIIAHRLT